MTQKINKLYLGKHRDDIVMTEYNELWDKADFCNRYYYNSYGLLYRHAYQHERFIVVLENNTYREL
jgi:hypothetical protein